MAYKLHLFSFRKVRKCDYWSESRMTSGKRNRFFVLESETVWRGSLKARYSRAFRAVAIALFYANCDKLLRRGGSSLLRLSSVFPGRSTSPDWVPFRVWRFLSRRALPAWALWQRRMRQLSGFHTCARPVAAVMLFGSSAMLALDTAGWAADNGCPRGVRVRGSVCEGVASALAARLRGACMR